MKTIDANAVTTSQNQGHGEGSATFSRFVEIGVDTYGAFGSVSLPDKTPVTIISGHLASKLRWRDGDKEQPDTNRVVVGAWKDAKAMDVFTPPFRLFHDEGGWSNYNASSIVWRELIPGIDSPSAEVGT